MKNEFISVYTPALTINDNPMKNRINIKANIMRPLHDNSNILMTYSPGI